MVSSLPSLGSLPVGEIAAIMGTLKMSYIDAHVLKNQGLLPAASEELRPLVNGLGIDFQPQSSLQMAVAPAMSDVAAAS